MSAPTGIGTLTVRALDPLKDAELLHSWVTHPKASYWMMQDAKLQDVEREYMRISAHEYHHAYLGLHEGRPAFLMESYDPRYVELEGLYDPEPGDVGMHFLVAPTDRPIHGFTKAVITAVMDELFADPRTRRVVVEPDVSNKAVHALNEAVGFVPEREIDKPEKRALLSFCTRDQYLAARGVAI
ncbi:MULTISPECIES: GNAT family N-acetyltransferase [Streptomyces]|uniref:Lysine N-acyltransferase MbtK n=1 Tax=Streptomyces koelreuteriae TaxID=2838015 RepID=A0ABX8FWB8_9ACTN|nr:MULTISPECIES: GNAT family N-acetyltransferase [Streptomyces]QWB25394.1 GNAT family N-acetyltransferase [Streptomyces koelreuteriae]UUA08436.1 acetyltransferase [Streptomyces koelreuteriae]UUA16041.1 acetyltransferase [Streptomyces sp. CRCS-T-1]